MRARAMCAGDGFGIPQMWVFRGVSNTVIFPILGLKKKHKRSTLFSRSTKFYRPPRHSLFSTRTIFFLWSRTHVLDFYQNHKRTDSALLIS